MRCGMGRYRHWDLLILPKVTDANSMCALAEQVHIRCHLSVAAPRRVGAAEEPHVLAADGPLDGVLRGQRGCHRLAYGVLRIRAAVTLPLAVPSETEIRVKSIVP